MRRTDMYRGSSPTKAYLGIIAEMKAGKSSVFDIVEILVRSVGGTAEMINFSDPMRDALRHGLSHMIIDRRALQGISHCVRREFGDDVWAKEIAHLAGKSQANLVALVGMRRRADLELFCNLPNSSIIYLTAPILKRYEWLKAKAERPGDAEKTWEQFLAENEAEPERQIREIGEQAVTRFGGVRIDNVGTLEDLALKVRAAIRGSLDLSFIPQAVASREVTPL